MDHSSTSKAHEAWIRVSHKNNIRFLEDRLEAKKKEYFKGVHDTTSFFFTEFHEGLREKDIYSHFVTIGDIDGVIILVGRDKKGKIFNFVCFIDFRDVRIMENKLDNLFIKGMKLFDNVPKFHKGDLDPKRNDVMGKQFRFQDEINVGMTSRERLKNVRLVDSNQNRFYGIGSRGDRTKGSEWLSYAKVTRLHGNGDHYSLLG